MPITNFSPRGESPAKLSTLLPAPPPGDSESFEDAELPLL